MVLSARVALSVIISEHVHVVHGVGSVTCQALTCLSIARKNHSLNSLSFWLGSFMSSFAEFLSEGNILVHLPLQVLTIHHMLPASPASWRHLCAYLYLALVKACLRQQEANLCSVGVFTVHASVWVALHSLFYHFSPFGHGGCLVSRMVQFMVSMVLFTSVSSLWTVNSCCYTPGWAQDGLTLT